MRAAGDPFGDLTLVDMESSDAGGALWVATDAAGAHVHLWVPSRNVGMMSVTHAGVIPVLHRVLHEGVEGAVMPLDRSPSLQDVLRRGRVDRATARRWAVGLSRALQWAHDGRTVHGAVSPRRVRVDGPDARWWGFGTGPDLLVVDPGNPGPSTTDSDIHAFGALIYEILTGNPPFLGPDRAARAATGAHTPLGVLCPELPASLSAMVYAMLSPSPAGRPARLPDAFDDEWPDTTATLGRPAPPTIVAFEKSPSDDSRSEMSRDGTPPRPPQPLIRVEYVPPREQSLTEPMGPPRPVDEMPPWVGKLAIAGTLATILFVLGVLALIALT